ncbi:GntR family transcriptional regulator [Kitasatospora sp. NPDC051702]|uniref:GntR family transcriptional regulator n=1 Tax=Kitasatospora sp. NPDC051702 TaxID=3155672 RepID=UPI00343FF0EC
MAEDLRRRIGSGALAAGSKLPSESELAATYEVGLPTLRRALDELQSEGLIEKFHGNGNFVRRPVQPITYSGGRHLQDLPAACPPALRIEVTVTEVKAAGELQSLLRVRAKTPVVERVYLSEQAGRPCSLARVYVPRALDAPLPEAPWSPWGDDVRAHLLARGIPCAATAERVTARFPSAEEADALRIVARIPVLAIERTSMDRAGRVVMGVLLVLPSDRAEAVFSTSGPELAGVGK